MFKKILHSLAILSTVFLLSVTPVEEPVMETKTVVVKTEKYVSAPQVKTLQVKTINREEKDLMSKADKELIALVTMAEAEGESDFGKRLVIDTILNRLDSEIFPDTVNGVIYQENQFTSMHNGRVNKCYVRDDIYDLVEQELNHRTNVKVMFFHAGRYSNYGSPLLNEGGHYFSGI